LPNTLVLDFRARKGIAKRNWFNISGFSHDKSAESYKLQLLKIKKKEIDNQKIVTMPKEFNTVTKDAAPKNQALLSV